MTPSLPDHAKELLDAATLVVLTTVNADGSPQSSPVWAERDGEQILMSTIHGRKKTRNLERDPRASVVIVDPANPFSYFSVNGSVSIAEDAPGALIEALSQKYTGKPYTGDDGTDNRRVIVRLTPEHVTGQ